MGVIFCVMQIVTAVNQMSCEGSLSRINIIDLAPPRSIVCMGKTTVVVVQPWVVFLIHGIARPHYIRFSYSWFHLTWASLVLVDLRRR
jgi:hypothetical protein